MLAGNESVYHRRAFREFGERCARGMSLSIRIGWGGKLDTDPGLQGAPKVTGRTEVPPGGPVGCATRHGRRKERGGGKGWRQREVIRGSRWGGGAGGAGGCRSSCCTGSAASSSAGACSATRVAIVVVLVVVVVAAGVPLVAVAGIGGSPTVV